MSYSPQDIARFAEIQHLKEEIAKLEGRIQTSRADSPDLYERHQGQQDQAYWQEAYDVHGRIAPPQREHESNASYNRRLATALQPYSKEWRGTDLFREPVAVVDKILPLIRQDAMDPASHAFDVPPGQIKEIKTKDITGRGKFEFVSGDPKTTFISLMARPRQIIGRMLGVDRVGAPTQPVENPERMGRMPMRGAFPR